MSIYVYLVVGIIVGGFLLELLIEGLNIRHLSPNVPGEFKDICNADKYKKTQAYQKENVKFGLFREAILVPLLLLFIFMGGFNLADEWAREFGLGIVGTGLVFAAILYLLGHFIGLPFSIYDTFVIEEKFGFNKTTWKTFLLDEVKGLLLAFLFGGIVFGVVIWFFERMGTWAWVYSWMVVVGFELIILFIAPVLIMPLFNKFIPLEEGGLREAIEDFTRSQKFKMKGIFTMDGSRRSTKANAFFTGFGRFKRIVLFDTLVEKHTEEELVAVLAHEIGHYKKKHTMKFFVLSILMTGLMFYFLSLFINNPGIAAAFQVEQVSVYSSLIFVGLLYSPISKVISVFTNSLSRSFEFQADRFSAETYGKPESLITALKKMSVDQLSNLTPHRLKVFMEYSHPPVIQRVHVLRKDSS